MERKKALAVAGAVTLVLGTSVVAASAMGGVGLLGFGGSSASGIGAFTPSPTTAKPGVVTRTRDVYDQYVVDDSTGSASGGTGASGSASAPQLPGTGGNAPAALPSGSGTSTDDPPSRPSDPPTTAHVDDPAPTTAPPSPPTTRHVEIPEDWPPGTPLPPMPPNCQQPHLEDNGVWNCGGDD